MVEANDGNGPLGWRQVSPRESRELIRQSANEMAGMVRSTLGPSGLDKLVVRPQEDGTVRGFASNDGVSIIEEFEGHTDHPVATHFIQMVEAQEEDYGDGTTTAAILTAELLSEGLSLVDDGVGANAVVEGFSMAAQRTLEAWSELAVPLTDDAGDYDNEALARVAITGLSNGDESLGLDGFADDVVAAVRRVAHPKVGGVDLDSVRTETMPGAGITDSELVTGGLVRKDLERDYVSLPVSGPFLFADGDVKPRGLRADSDVSLDGRAETLDAFRDSDAAARRCLAAAIRDVGVAGVVTSGDVDNEVGRLLGAAGIVAVQEVPESRAAFLARASGGVQMPSISTPEDVERATLGEGRLARREGYEDKRWLELIGTGPDAPPAMTFVVHAGSKSVADEAERRVKDGLNAVRAALLDPTGLPAGGAAEVAAARSVRSLAPSITGREQLAVEAFADVLDGVTLALARNAGLDAVDGLLELRTRHAAGHANAGISADRDVVDDMLACDAVESKAVKASALVRAVEFAVSYLRVDSMVVSDTKTNPLPAVE